MINQYLITFSSIHKRLDAFEKVPLEHLLSNRERRAKENRRFRPMECQNHKVHLLIKLSDCCLFTIALSHLSSQVFAKDYYHQPSLSNLFLLNACIQCIHGKKIKTGCYSYHHTSAHTKKKDNLFNQSINPSIRHFDENKLNGCWYRMGKQGQTAQQTSNHCSNSKKLEKEKFTYTLYVIGRCCSNLLFIVHWKNEEKEI